MARGHRKIIWTPHKPGMITRWPFYVTPPRPRSRSPAVVLVVTPAGDWVFLEVNQSGEWGWLAHETGIPVANALADLLSVKGQDD